MSHLRLLGLTGSIATGKSFAASVFDRFGVPVFDADATVHALLGPGGAAVGPVGTLFPQVRDDSGGIDRRRLGARVFGDDAALAALEAILHPLVRDAERSFLERCARAGAWLAVLDVPLLFETGGDARVDRTVVVTCHPALQAQRALRRPGMTPQRLELVRRRQLPEAAKRKRADYLVFSGQGKGAALAAIRAIILDMRHCPSSAWPHRWLLNTEVKRRRAA